MKSTISRKAILKTICFMVLEEALSLMVSIILVLGLLVFLMELENVTIKMELNFIKDTGLAMVMVMVIIVMLLVIIVMSGQTTELKHILFNIMLMVCFALSIRQFIKY